MASDTQEVSAVVIDDDVVENFIASFSSDEKRRLLAIYKDIGLYIDDQFNGMALADITHGISEIQEALRELEKMLPIYTPYLRDSMDRYGDEMSVSEHEAEAILGDKRTPPIVLKFYLVT